MNCLETIRAALEDCENIEKAVSLLLIERESSTGSKSVHIEHRIKYLLETSVKKMSVASELIEDKDGLKFTELCELGGSSSSSVWDAFYGRLRECESSIISDTPVCMAASDWMKESLISLQSLQFSGAEGEGLYLDMSDLHANYLNLRKLQEFKRKEYADLQWSRKLQNWPAQMPAATAEQRSIFLEKKQHEFSSSDYITWLKTFPAELSSIPRFIKYRDSDYSKYLSDLHEYLANYLTRQQPLLAHPINEWHEEFENLWNGRNLTGWETLSSEMECYAQLTDRLFANKNVLQGHLNSKLYTKLGELDNVTCELVKLRSELLDRETALEEFLITRLAHVLKETTIATIREVQRKQARTGQEIIADLEQLESSRVPQSLNEDDAMNSTPLQKKPKTVTKEDSSKAVYNPLNLPLGWDGKPIPYWLYKLHGLGVEYRCEICGNFSYWGLKAFEKHFSEGRHTHGLKCLRIENGPEYRHIASIQDALALSAKILKRESFDPTTQAECEDSMGNVMTAKTYQDLSRQGLL